MRPRQSRFVDEYLTDRNGAAAAVRAGYSRRTARQIAHELLTKPDVAAAVRAGEAGLAATAQVAREDALRGFLTAIDVARAKGDPAAMIAGWREIGRMCGYYAPERHEVHVGADASTLRRSLEELPDAELLAIATGG